ncbi:MAG: hypothetical protein ACR2I0_00050, partial [Rhodoferax sp.]
MAAGALTYFYRDMTHQQLVKHEQQHAEDLTQVFENSLWLHFRELTHAPKSDSIEVMRLRAVDSKLHDPLAEMMRGTDVIKVKIYSLSGSTVFSTDPRQIGESKASNAGFLSALNNVPIGELTHRNTFDA